MSSVYVTIKEILSTTTVADPRQIARMVKERADADSLETLYDSMLSEYVRNILRNHRQEPTSDRPGRSGSVSRAGRAPEAAPTSTPARSWKVAAIRSAWADHLAGRYCVGETWKTLGECSHADVLALMTARRDEAARNAAWADRFALLADAMEKKGATTVADLKDDDLATAFA